MDVANKISAVVVARNEEANIGFCLETLRWCDEIVVVDMESSDRTVEIAKNYTDLIFNHRVVLAFDIAKKFAVERATGDWVLLLDADEMIPPSLAAVLRGISDKEEIDIVEIPFRHYIMGACVEHTGWGYTPLPRFFRRNAIAFTEKIHDYMHISHSAVVSRLGSTLENCIIHFNYRDSFHFVEKLNRYTTIEAQHLFDNERTFSVWILMFDSMREFYRRYFPGKGYSEGVRGFSLSLMMSFYRALSYVKLWELYTFRNRSVEAHYECIRQKILEEWQK